MRKTNPFGSRIYFYPSGHVTKEDIINKKMTTKKIIIYTTDVHGSSCCSIYFMTTLTIDEFNNIAIKLDKSFSISNSYDNTNIFYKDLTDDKNILTYNYKYFRKHTNNAGEGEVT